MHRRTSHPGSSIPTSGSGGNRGRATRQIDQQLTQRHHHLIIDYIPTTPLLTPRRDGRGGDDNDDADDAHDGGDGDGDGDDDDDENDDDGAQAQRIRDYILNLSLGSKIDDEQVTRTCKSRAE